MNRLNTEKNLAPYVAQFVPLKVDVATPEYAALQRKHRSEGNTIPKIFLIRADGEKLYAKSGSLSGEQLPNLMVAALREMGRPLALSEVKVLEEMNGQIKSAIEKEDFRAAATQFNKLKKLGDFGEIGSFAQSALENNQLAAQFKEKISGLVEQYETGLDSQDEPIVSAIKALTLKSEVSMLLAFKVPMNQLEKKIRGRLESAQALTELKNVASAVKKLDHKSESIRKRAVVTLHQFVNKSDNVAAQEFLNAQIEKTGIDPKSVTVTNVRTWTSSDRKFSVKAELVDFNDKQVKLKKDSGETIVVPLDRLSAEDKEFISRQK